MIVWVASYPRSGNRFCRTFLKQAVGNDRVPSMDSEAALRRDLGALLDRLGVGPSDDVLSALREHDSPVFLKTHRLPQYIHALPEKPRKPVPEGNEGSPALYLVRDGRDCLVSLAHYLKGISGKSRFQSMSFEEVIYSEMTESRARFGGWSAHVGAWRRRNAPTEIVWFEELIEDPVEAVEAATQALGFVLPEQRVAPRSFDALRSRSSKPELLRRGKVGSWRSEFPPHLLDEFWERHGHEMEALGYPRE